MGTLTVRFKGICTHFTENVPVSHRVVLVNARNGADIFGVHIPPHIPLLSIGGSQPLGPVMLAGLWIQVANPSGPLDPTPPEVPNLTLLMQPVQTLSVPSPEYVTGQDPELVACYFDVDAGSFEIFGTGGTVDTMVKITTVGEPVLTFTPFPGATLPPQLSPVMPIPSDTIITLANEASMDEEKFPDAHFLLHYLTARDRPTVPQVPQPDRAVPSVAGGCSNSNYP